MPFSSKCTLGLKLLGIRGFIGILTVLIIGGLLVYSYLNFMDRPWYILLVAIGAFLLPIMYVYEIRKQIMLIAKSTIIKNTKLDEINPDEDNNNNDETNENNNQEEQLDQDENRKSYKQQASEVAKAAGARYYNVTDPNGKYYILKTYASEILEYFFQILAILVYNCNFPIQIVITIYFLLLFEAIGVAIDTVWTIQYGISVKRRNNKVMVDIMLEVISAAVPIMIMFFAYGLLFTKVEFIQLAVIPAIFALSKLYEIVDATIWERGFIILKRKKQKASMKLRRLSFFKSWRDLAIEDENEKIAEEQMNHTPWIAHVGFFIIVMSYCIFLLLLIIVQLATITEAKCEVSPEIWNGCTVKVYFCNKLLQPTCDCAVIDIERHNMTVLPKSMFQLNALKNIRINNGPLEYIPKEIENLKKVVVLDLNYNMLTNIPNEISTLGIVKLRLANNKLNTIPDEAWGLDSIAWLELDNNNISHIPENIKNAKSLTTLFLSNNTVNEVKAYLFQLPLISLMLDGNNIRHIPVEISKLMNKLQFLKLQNNKIVDIPAEIGQLDVLWMIDLRNNNVSYFPKEMAIFGKKNNKKKYLYIYGNPICVNGWMSSDAATSDIKQLLESSKAGCTKQCSPYCTYTLLKQKQCLRECNSEACEYQKGTCLRSEK